jgi:hypothetical protein
MLRYRVRTGIVGLIVAGAQMKKAPELVSRGCGDEPARFRKGKETTRSLRHRVYFSGLRKERGWRLRFHNSWREIAVWV